MLNSSISQLPRFLDDRLRIRKFWALYVGLGILILFYSLNRFTNESKIPELHNVRVETFQPKLTSKAYIVRKTNHKGKKFTFLVAGVAKCGTTSLHYMLREHPHLYLPPRKEIRFFMREDVNWTDPDYASYESYISNDRRSNMIGEASPGYIFWPHVLERINRYNPDMKLILIFCDPIKRVWSHWDMVRRRGGEYRTFKWSIREGHRYFMNLSTVTTRNGIYSYVAQGFYGYQLARLFTIFPREQILLLTKEDLSMNSTGMLKEISRFLNVPQPNNEIKAAWKNQATFKKTMDPDDVEYLRNIYNEDFKSFVKLSGLNVTHWLE